MTDIFVRLALLFLTCFSCWSQETRVTGLVVSKGRPIPGVTVEARLDGPVVASTVTDEDGRFRLVLPAGEITITSDIFGFAPLAKRLSAEDHLRPVELQLMLATGPVVPLAVAATEEAPAPTPAIVETADATESLLVQGSLSRGVDGAEVVPLDDGGGGPALEPETGSKKKGGGKKGSGGAGELSALSGGGGARVRKAARGNKQKAGKRAGPAVAFGNKSKKSKAAIRGMVSLQARTSALDATPYAINGQSLLKPDYSQAKYAATLGGPLFGTQFTLNFQGTRNTNPYTSFSTVPTAAERTGDFSNTRSGSVLFDPATQAPFPGNRIPATRIPAVSAGVLKLIPEANQTGLVQNFRIVTTVPQNSRQLSLSLAKPVTVRDRLNFQLSWQGREGVNVQPYGFRDPTQTDGRHFELRWNHTFSPRLIFTSHAKYNLNRSQLTPAFANQRDVSGELGIVGNSREAINWGPPNLNFTNYGDLQDGAHSNRRIHTWTYGGGLTFVRGRVTTTAGVEFTRAQWNTFAEQNARGTLFFGGLLTSGRFNGFPQANTGSDFADFLLGLPQQASLRAGGADTYLRASTFSAYVQQSIKVSRTFTVSVGNRYEVWRPFTERYDRMVNLDLNPQLTRVEAVLPGATGAFSGAYPRGLVDTDWNNLSPRVGVAWKPHKRLAVRGGYGMYMDGTAISRLPTRLAAQPPFATTSNFNTSATNVLTLANPFTGSRDVRVRNSYAVDRHYLIPYAQSWNYALDFDLPRHLALELTYLGTKGTRLVMQRQPNRAAPGSPANSEDRRQIENAVGFNYDSTEGNSIFHAGQVKVQRKYAKGLGWSALYTFAKSIDNATSVGGAGNVAVQDDRNYAAERGLSNFDRRHSLTGNTVIASPFGRTGYFLRDRENVWGRLLEGWSLTVATTARAGTPLTARVLGNVADAAGTGATGSGRASATGLPISGGRYFNTAAFGLPLAGQYGNAGRNTIRGPAFVTASASLGRSFRMGDSARRRLEVRVEGENLLNQVNVTGLGVVVNALEYGLATRAGEMRSLNFTARFRF